MGCVVCKRERSADRFGDALVVGAALHVERLDRHREPTEQDRLVYRVVHLPLGRFRYVLPPHSANAY